MRLVNLKEFFIDEDFFIDFLQTDINFSKGKG